MSQRCVESVLGRLITDATFREQFFETPEDICRDHTLELTATELTALLQIDEERLITTAATLDPRIVRAVIGSTAPSARRASAQLQPPKRSKHGAP
ncbi:MAG TPA: Os1348 family NHLP clan protein [Candidatus Acidoferrales bacterium]|nr:Os1348 family NHLP clan protein [Candidatus Acidoferrales bacterium]